MPSNRALIVGRVHVAGEGPLIIAMPRSSDSRRPNAPFAPVEVGVRKATAVGLRDRGAIEAGLRADIVRVGMCGTRPVPLGTYVRGTRVA